MKQHETAPLMDDKLLTQGFIQRLPPNLRMVLASSSDDLSIQALARLADEMMEAIGSSTVHSTHDDNSVGAVGSSPPHPPSSLESEIIGHKMSLVRQLPLPMAYRAAATRATHAPASETHLTFRLNLNYAGTMTDSVKTPGGVTLPVHGVRPRESISRSVEATALTGSN